MSDRHVERVAALFDEVAADYDQHVPFFTAFATQLVDWTGVKSGERVLDIGTGRGAVAAAARSRGAEVVALDIAAQMLRHGSGPRLRADARRLPLRDNSFDLAIGAFSIHLLPDPVAGLREAARTVRPGGRVVLAHGGRFSADAWDFWNEILLGFADRGTRPATLPTPTPIADSYAAFHEAGLADVRLAEGEIAIPVRDPIAFLRGEQAHGARSFFDRLEPDVRQELESALLAGLWQMHRAGGITLCRAALFVEGRVT